MRFTTVFPLLMYITDNEAYQKDIVEITEKLSQTLPMVCTYFHDLAFMNVLKELNRYDKAVVKHYEAFEIWARAMKALR